MRKMTRRSAALFFSAGTVRRSLDQHFPYQQDANLFRLTGIEQAGTILLLHPGAKNPDQKEVLFILPKNRKAETWNGLRMTQSQATAASGISTIFSSKEFTSRITELFRQVDHVYICPFPYAEEQLADPVPLDPELHATLSLGKKNQWLDPTSILTALAMVKHPEEINLMKKAIGVTGQAFSNALGVIRPGIKEYELEASITHTIIAHGCTHAFEPIIASGPAACTLHYVRNDRVIRNGELVLMDFGAAYAHMCSDMTRTIPASGQFSKRQREVYDAVLRVLTEIRDMMRPGIKLSEINREAGKLIDTELVRLHLFSKNEIRLQSKTTPLRKKYFMHSIGHHLGYDVHDLAEKDTPLKPGMILTCEPGLYIREEKLGIRLENDILIRRGAPLDLMADIPIEAEAIESLIHQNSISGH